MYFEGNVLIRIAFLLTAIIVMILACIFFFINRKRSKLHYSLLLFSLPVTGALAMQFIAEAAIGKDFAGQFIAVRNAFMILSAIPLVAALVLVIYTGGT